MLYVNTVIKCQKDEQLNLAYSRIELLRNLIFLIKTTFF